MKELVFDPFPKLTTDRLNLRSITVDDAAAMHGLRSNREVMKLLDRPLTNSIEDAEKLIHQVFESQQEGTAVMWAMALKEDSAMIGCICLVRIEAEHCRTEVGYLLDPKFHRQGLMSEALEEVLRFAVDDLEFHKITACTNPLNVASIGLQT